MRNKTRVGYEYIDNDIIFEIGKFTILWNMFERECKCKVSFSNIKKNMTKIDNNYNKEIFENFINVIKERAMQIYPDEEDYIEKYISHKLYPKDDKRAIINDFQRYEEIPIVKNFFKKQSIDNLIGAIFAIKRIRNNMFHGLKDEYFLDFFKSINNILEYLINKIWGI